MNKLKIVFAGTPQFAESYLSSLINSRHDVISVFTQPSKRSGRGLLFKHSPVRNTAKENNINIRQPEKITIMETDALTELEPDIVVVVAYGLMLTKEFISVPKFGCINVHGSLLPRWRGASPMEYSILEGDKKSGLSYMQMSEGLDEGPVYETHECSINHEDSLGRLEEKLIALSKENLNSFLSRLEKGQLKPKDQDSNLATFAPKISKEILQLDWVNQNAQNIICKINAFEPKYGAYFLLGGKRIKIHKAKEISSLPSSIPGTISILENEMIISCKDATSVQIEIIQMEGKNKVSGQEFISAYEDLIKSHKKIEFTTR